MSKRVTTLAALACGLLSLFAVPASAQRVERPTGQEVSQRTAQAKLRAESALTAEESEASFKFIPADLRVKGVAALEGGAVIGILEVTEKSGGGRRRYNLFLAKTRGQWRLYIESEKKIVGEIERVEVKEVAELPKDRERVLKVERAKPGAPRPGNGFAPRPPLMDGYYCWIYTTSYSTNPYMGAMPPYPYYHMNLNILQYNVLAKFY